MIISVPIFFLEVISIANPNLLQSFLHRYRPIPVDFLPDRRPLVPVNPFSKTRDNSLSLIPKPLSFIYKMVFLYMIYYIFLMLIVYLYFDI